MRRNIAILILPALILTGCWGMRDISELALVTAVAIDRTDNNLVRVTVQIARPTPGTGGAGGGGLAGSVSPVRVVSAEAPSVFEAIRVLAGSASRRLMWAHNQVIVIGLSQAEHGVKEIVDFFTRNPELRYRTPMAMADGEARSLLVEQTGLENLPGVSIEKSFRYAPILGVARRVDVKEFAAAGISGEMSPILPVIRLVPMLVHGNESERNHRDEVEIVGLAAFHGGRLATKLSPAASRGLLLVQGQMGRAIVSVPCPEGSGDPVTVEVVNSKPKIRLVQTSRTGARFDLSVRVTTAITSVGCPANFRDLRVRQKIEGSVAALFARDIDQLLAEAKESGTDPIGLGQHVRSRLPRLWRQWSSGWPDALSKAGIHHQVEVSIVGSEVLLRPTVWGGGAGRGE